MFFILLVVDGTGAGFGNLEVIVQGGRVSSHVSTVSKEKFSASFVPHDLGRHRIDVKFNGEKVPNSPWFVDVSKNQILIDDKCKETCYN